MANIFLIYLDLRRSFPQIFLEGVAERSPEARQIFSPNSDRIVLAAIDHVVAPGVGYRDNGVSIYSEICRW